MLLSRIAIFAMMVSLSYAPAQTKKQVTSDAVPVIDVDGGCLLGGSVGGKWLKDQAMSTRMSGGDKYRTFDLNGEWKSLTGGKAGSNGAPCEETLYVEIPKDIQEARPEGRHYIGVAGNWNPMPRSIRIENSKSGVYRNAVESQLQKKGIRRPQVQITKVVRVDLDGDGVEEVIVNATRANRWDNGSIKHDANVGDYSLVMLRKIIDGKVQTIMLDEEYHPKYVQTATPNEFDLVAILDLNGDGVMEIIVAGAYYEGNWKTVYSIEGNKAVDVIGCGCGA